MKDETILSIVTIIAVLVLLAWALYLGYDNVLLASGLGIIAGLGGYEVGKRQKETQGTGIEIR